MAQETDFLVIGSGLAGLAFALKACKIGSVTLISKAELRSTNTNMAQGGIASVMGDDDNFEKHIQDTLIAGAGLCHRPVVEQLVRQAPERINELVNWGVRFDAMNSHFDLTREGGHSQRRILHVADHTGEAIQCALAERVRETKNIEILENHLAVDLVTSRQAHPLEPGAQRCLGAFIMNKERGTVEPIIAKATILATGGAGKVYLYTSNWSGATGDGIAMAYRAGARVADLEFMQFHPTCLYHPQARNFLISEALRGEGGELITRRGQAFMKKYHPLGSLAPRDIVARSIDAEMKKSGDECVFLDMSKLSSDFLVKRFPAIHAKCLEHGIDMTKQPIPVVPAAHHLAGGVLTDVAGRTDIEGLFALGETACTGMHGANRLASNSLLECIGMAHNAVQELERRPPSMPTKPFTPPEWHSQDKADADELIVVSHMWDEIRRMMWNYVGIVRSNRRLERAQRRLLNILEEIDDYDRSFRSHPDIVELRNIALVAHLTVKCALRRKESRGIHYNIDYPFANDSAVRAEDSILGPGILDSTEP